MKSKFILIVAVAFFTITVIIALKNPPSTSKEMVAMDTVIEIIAEGWGAEGKTQLALDRVRDVEARMSKNSEKFPNSEVVRINRGDTYWGNRETIRVINRGIYFGGLSNGLFDISIGAIVELYEKAEPSPEEAQRVAALVNYKNLTINQPIPSGMRLDLGGIAKGYAGDEAVLALRKAGINNIMVNMGGDIVTAGDKKWKIGVRNPFADSNSSMGTLEITNKAVATSGAYERGQHIYDPRTGKPVDNNIASATVIAGSGMDADALATIAYIMGKDAFALIRAQGAECILITKNHEVFTSFGEDKKLFRITDKKFTYVE